MLSLNVKLFIAQNFFVGCLLYSGILVIYFAQVTGSYALAMSIFSITMISAAILEIPTGVFSDMIGRKNTIMLGGLAAVLYTSCYALGGSYWLLAFGAVLQGLSRSLWSGNNDALLYESLPEQDKEHLFAKYAGKAGSAEQAALAVASVVGGVLAMWSFPLVMWLTVIFQIFGLLVTVFMVEPLTHSKKSGNIYQHLKEAVGEFKKNYRLRLLSGSSILGFAFGESVFQFRPAFVNTLWPLWAVGLSQTLSFIGASVSFYFAGAIIKRFNALKILLIDHIASRFINIISYSFPTVVSPLLITLTSFGHGLGSTAQSTLMQKEFTHSQRATMGSLNSLAGSFCFAIVSFCLGLVADKIGVTYTLLITQFFIFIPIFLLWKLFSHQNRS